MTNYQYTTEAINQYYNSPDQWQVITNYNITPENVETALGQIQGANVVKSANGKVLSYNFQANENMVSDVASEINSNVSSNIKSFEIPANTGIKTVTDEAGQTIKNVTFKSGLSKAGNFVFGKVLPAVGAVATGITLGKTIDSLLYKANPKFWNEHDMEYINPETWGDIVGNDTAGGKFFNFLFGTSPSGKTQAYMDDQALAYMSLYLQNMGVLDASTNYEVYENADTESLNVSQFVNFPIMLAPNTGAYKGHGDSIWTTYSTNAEKTVIFRGLPEINYGGGFIVVASSKPISGYISGNNVNITTPDTLNGKPFYHTGVISNIEWTMGATNESIPGTQSITRQIAYTLIYGDTKSKSDIEGIGNQDNANTVDLSNAKTVEEVLEALKKQYPDLFNGAQVQEVVQPDGSIITHTYVPVSMPELDPEGNPVSSPSTQAKPEIEPAPEPDPAIEPLLNTILDIISKPTPPNPPDTGKGKTPVIPPLTGSASALFAIYNPTLDQINQFGAWLWSDNFIEQIKKLFSDPMQAIIGLHKVYATPATNGTTTIKVGYLDSGVPAKIVSNQYTDIDCGTVSLSEYFYNVFDYAPYTSVNLYLPFIGIVGLDVADVMRSSIHIVYHVDVLSGACLAEVKVIRDSFGGTLYQYAGNASVTLPISSGSYMGIVSSIAGIAGGIAGTIASGGSALPLVASSAGSLLNAHTNVEHSGGFSGNAGAMGAKIPYLIISRPQVEMASNFERYIGYPANATTKLSACSGYVKVVESHLENINATDSELTEIDSLLKGGIII